MRWKTVGECRILDFDLETIAAGFGDPDWVPQKITCAAWSWVGSDTVESRVATTAGLFGKPKLRARMLKPLVAAIREADMVTGHNIVRFDLPILNAECVRLGLGPLPSLSVQDTMRLPRAKGLKKGQDNLSRLMGVDGEKLVLDWQQWQDAYDEDGWQTVRRRCESDVRMHMELRAKLLAAGVLEQPRMWHPFRAGQRRTVGASA